MMYMPEAIKATLDLMMPLENRWKSDPAIIGSDVSFLHPEEIYEKYSSQLIPQNLKWI